MLQISFNSFGFKFSRSKYILFTVYCNFSKKKILKTCFIWPTPQTSIPGPNSSTIFTLHHILHIIELKHVPSAFLPTYFFAFTNIKSFSILTKIIDFCEFPNQWKTDVPFMAWILYKNWSHMLPFHKTPFFGRAPNLLHKLYVPDACGGATVRSFIATWKHRLHIFFTMHGGRGWSYEIRFIYLQKQWKVSMSRFMRSFRDSPSTERNNL